MATRRERVVLDLESNLPEGMLRGAGATQVLRMELDRLSKASVSSSRVTTAASRDMDKMSTSANKTDRSINQLTGRLALFADAAAILGPALVPIGAVAVPAVTGLAAQLGFAAVAGTGFVVAVQGMGEALKAMNAAHLDPTTENLAKARAEMEKLSPAGQDLTRQIFGMRDEWQRLKDVSQGALFPGVSEALDSLETRLPEFERILVNVNTAVGDLLADGADSLGSPRWDDFFDFIATDAPPALAGMAAAFGNIAHAMSEMWMAFDPLNDDFSNWLVDSTGRLDEWAQGLARTQGFADFVDYIRETGPQVAETMGALATAVLRIVEAAAPLGGPVLAALEGVADAIGAIAGSDAGTSIMATVTALALLRRGMAGMTAIQATSWAQGVKGADTFTGKVAAARTPILRTSAAMGGLALASSGVADGLLLSNAATGAMLGMLGGPWGAAVGGAVGLMLDLTASTDGFKVNADSLTATLNQQTGAITANTTAFAAKELEQQGVLKAAQDLNLSLADVTQASLGNADAQDRVTASLAAQDAAFFDANGRVLVSTETLMAHRESASLVGDAIGVMSGELADGQTRIGRMADATDAGTAAYERAEQAAKDFSDAVTRLNNVLSGRASMRDYEAAIDDFTEAIKENGNTFDINTEKGRENQGMLDGIVTNTLKVAEGMKGAARQKFLTGAISDLREMGERFDIPKSQIKILIAMLRDANNARVKPKIDADTREAMAAIERMRAALAGLKDKSVNIRVTRTGVATSGDMGPQITPADGITVPGQRYPYGDKIHAFLAPGEEVISNRYGQADRHRSLLKRINANAMADGGSVGRPTASSLTPEFGGMFDLLAPGLGQFNEAAKKLLRASQGQLDAATGLADAARSQRDAVQAQMDSIAQGTISGFNTNLFDQSSNPWGDGAGGGPLHNLNKDIAGLGERDALQQQLAALGLTGDAASALLSQGSNADISALIARGEVGQYASLYAQRASLQGSVGGAARSFYSAEMAAASDTLVRMESQVQNLTEQLAAQQHEREARQAAREERREARADARAERQADETGAAFAQGGNKAARRRRRD